ncbi:MAG: cytochrome c [Patulibacter sp.]
MSSRTGRRAAILGIAATVALAAGCGSSGSSESTTGSSSTTGSQLQASTGKEIFQKAGCVSCHQLAAAGGSGNIGPDLDKAKPGRDEIIDTVTNGDGPMPAFKDRLSADQISTLAEYIVSVEGT